MNYSVSWTLSLKRCLLLKWGHWLGKNGILQVGMGCMGRPWWSWGYWASKFWRFLFASEEFLPTSGRTGSPIPAKGSSPPIVESHPTQRDIPLSTCARTLTLHCPRKPQWPPMSQLPHKTILSRLRIHPTTLLASRPIITTQVPASHERWGTKCNPWEGALHSKRRLS